MKKSVKGVRSSKRCNFAIIVLNLLRNLSYNLSNFRTKNKAAYCKHV